MALGLPMNEDWEGGDQESAFNENHSYTILSWPEHHAKDVIELRRQQACLVLFFVAMAFNVLVLLMLIFVKNPDRGRVEAAGPPGSIPGPFERLPDYETTSSPGGLEGSPDWHLAAVLLIAIWGMVAVAWRSATGVVVYLAAGSANLLLGLGEAPGAVYACRFMLELVLLALARSTLHWLTFSWVTASVERGWG
ncbi:unnamed protein product, partial [Discosporangium mesarthrocarpum]